MLWQAPKRWAKGQWKPWQGAAAAAELAAAMVCLGGPLGTLQWVPEQARQALRRHDPMLWGGRQIQAV